MQNVTRIHDNFLDYCPVIGNEYLVDTRYGKQRVVYHGRITLNNPLTEKSKPGLYSAIIEHRPYYVVRHAKVKEDTLDSKIVISQIVNNKSALKVAKNNNHNIAMGVFPIMPEDNFNMVCCKEFITSKEINLKEHRNDKNVFPTAVEFSNLMTALSKNSLSINRLQTVLEIGGFEISGLLIKNPQTGEEMILGQPKVIK